MGKKTAISRESTDAPIKYKAIFRTPSYIAVDGNFHSGTLIWMKMRDPFADKMITLVKMATKFRKVYNRASSGRHFTNLSLTLQVLPYAPGTYNIVPGAFTKDEMCIFNRVNSRIMRRDIGSDDHAERVVQVLDSDKLSETADTSAPRYSDGLEKIAESDLDEFPVTLSTEQLCEFVRVQSAGSILHKLSEGRICLDRLYTETQSREYKIYKKLREY